MRGSLMAEHKAHNLGDMGSSPIPATMTIEMPDFDTMSFENAAAWMEENYDKIEWVDAEMEVNPNLNRTENNDPIIGR